MNQTTLADALLDGISGIVRNASPLINDNANHSEMVIFHLLAEEEQQTGVAMLPLSSIVRKMCVSRPAVTQCVDRLVSRELLVRIADPNDRRAQYVGLTEKGKEYFEKTRENATVVINRIISRMGENDAAQLAYLLGRLKSAVENEAELMK